MDSKFPLAITAATDGACSGNPGPGGWAGLIRFNDGSIEEFGGREEATTNNRMELKAALETLKRLKKLQKHPELTLKTDSKYLINGLTQWIINWKKKGWKTSNGKPVLNQDLWEDLDQANIKEIKMEYVKGHSGDIDNDRVDKIAVAFSKNLPVKLLEKDESSYTKNTFKNELENKNINPVDELNPLDDLLYKLDFAEKIAKKGYGLTYKEISELTDIPINEIEKKQKKWEWRQWTIEAMSNKLWQIKENK